MLEELREKYQSQLKRDPDKEFGPEFIRTTNLERRLVDEYEFDAIRLIHGDRSESIQPLGEIPEACPWFQLNGFDLPSAIRHTFAPLAAELPRLVALLQERCSHLYVEESDGKWLLHYFLDVTLYDRRRYYHVYTAGVPNVDPQASPTLSEYGWSIPDDLVRFYSVHDGFGPILGSGDLSVMAKMMDPICRAENFSPSGYRFADLLEFHPDDAGNAQCFHRDGERCMTVDWDHETWELSGEQEFFTYVDERLSTIDEE